MLIFVKTRYFSYKFAKDMKRMKGRLNTCTLAGAKPAITGLVPISPSVTNTLRMFEISKLGSEVAFDNWLLIALSHLLYKIVPCIIALSLFDDASSSFNPKLVLLFLRHFVSGIR